MNIELEKHEEILGRIRMHRVLLLRRMFIGLLVIFFLFSNTFLLFRAGLVGIVLFLATCAGVVLYLVQAYTVWNHTMILITSLRVIDIHQSSLRKREVHELQLGDITEVKELSEKTIMDRLFGSGTVRMYGAAHKDFDLECHHLPKPNVIVSLIEEARVVHKKHHA